MTKEDLEEKFEDCFDASTRASEGGYGPDVTDGRELWKLINPIIASYAKQQAVAFFKFCFPTTPDYDAHVAARYDQFSENQFIEQQNKE